MSKILTQWSQKEKKYLVQLCQEEIQQQQIDWAKIKKSLQEQFNDCQRTVQQCRDMYFTIKKDQQNNQIKLKEPAWTQIQLHLLRSLYEEHGSSWQLIGQKFLNRSDISVKNKFNNGIRRAARILFSHQTKTRRKSERNISRSMITSMLNFCTQLKRVIQKQGKKINQQSMIFTFRTKILNLLLDLQKFSFQDLTQLVALIKSINLKIRCFGVYKVKNPIQWKIKEKNLITICNFDNVIKQQVKKQQKAILVNQSTSLDGKQDKFSASNHILSNSFLKGSQIFINSSNSLESFKQNSSSDFKKVSPLVSPSFQQAWSQLIKTKADNN